MKVVEKFVSINGEGTHAGELAAFVRFKGCNLKCSYCDTCWANEPDCPYDEESPEEIAAYVKSTGVRNVTLTGGEPLLREDMQELLDLLAEVPELRVEIETNGAVDVSTFARGERTEFTMDYKLPGSGCEASMVLANFEALRERDTVKFVVSDRADLDRMREVVARYGLDEKCHVYLSPVFGRIEPVEIVDYMMEYGLNRVRLQIQMHKVIWDPEKRGV